LDGDGFASPTSVMDLVAMSNLTCFPFHGYSNDWLSSLHLADIEPISTELRIRGATFWYCSYPGILFIRPWAKEEFRLKEMNIKVTKIEIVFRIFACHIGNAFLSIEN
jgi:hypothetical protein